jgi:hypothetical protein
MKSIVVRAVALAAFGAVAAGLTAGTANARPLEERTQCTQLEWFFAYAYDKAANILKHEGKTDMYRALISQADAAQAVYGDNCRS